MKLYRVHSYYTETSRKDNGDYPVQEDKWFTSKKEANKYRVQKKKDIAYWEKNGSVYCSLYSSLKIELTKKGVLHFLNTQISLR